MPRRLHFATRNRHFVPNMFPCREKWDILIKFQLLKIYNGSITMRIAICDDEPIICEDIEKKVRSIIPEASIKSYA